MRFRLCIWIIPVLALFDCDSALADNIFRKPRPNPSECVPALIKTLSSDLDDRRRADAASELREYDTKTFPDIIPALAEALKNDASTTVRFEAANSIGKLRPISRVGGYALEQAEKSDPAIAVRVLARNHLRLWVLLHGHIPGRMPDPLEGQTAEPPLAEPLPGPMPKMGPTKLLPPSFHSPNVKQEAHRPAPPLVPSPMPVTAKNDRFIFQLMSRLKPDVKPNTAENGPVLNSPR